MLQTYFQGHEGGRAGVTPEDLDGVRAMVRDLNSLLEKHASGADTRADFVALHGARTAQYFPPGIETVDELIDHLHRQASQMASLLASMSPQHARRAAAADGRPAARRPAALGHGAPGRQPPGGCVPTSPFGEPYPFAGDEPMGLAQALAAIDRQQQFDTMEEQLLAARDPDALERLDAERAA